MVQGIATIPECRFQLLAAFGIPTASQDLSPLHAWLRRGKPVPLGLVMYNVDGMLQDTKLCQQFTGIVAELLAVSFLV